MAAYFSVLRAGRPDPRHEPRPRRPPDPRHGPQLQRQAVRGPRLRRPPGHRAHRLRRDGGAGPRGPAEAHRRRRERLPAPVGLRADGGHRPRRRGDPVRRHGPHRRARRGRRPPEPVPARGHRHDDDAQDPARTARRHDLRPRRAARRASTRPTSRRSRARSARRSTRPSSRASRAGRSCRSSPARRSPSSSPPRSPSARTSAGPSRNAAVLAETLADEGARVVSRRHRQPPDARRRDAARRDRQGGRAPARRDRHHRQQERHPVRPAAAQHGVRHPPGHAGHDVPWLRRGRDAPGRPDHHRGDPRARRRRGPAAGSPARSPRSSPASPSRGCPRRDHHDRHGRATPRDVHRGGRGQRRPDRRRLRRRGADRAAADAARPADGPCATASSTGPNARRVNTRPIPRAGGIAIAAAFLRRGGPVRRCSTRRSAGCRCRSTSSRRDLVALFGGGLAAAVIGALDDLFDLRARWQLLGQVAAGACSRSPSASAIDVINNPFGDGRHPVQRGVLGRVHGVLDRRDDQQHQLDRRARRAVAPASRSSPSVTLGLISLTTQVSQPLIARAVLRAGRGAAGFLRWNFHPATIFTGTSGVQFVGYTLAVLCDPRARPRSRSRCSSSACRSSTRSGSSSGASRSGARRSRRTGRTSTTGCSTSGLSHRDTVLVIYAICAVARRSLAAARPEVTQAYAFLGVFIVSGLILFGPTRGAFDGPRSSRPSRTSPTTTPMTRVERSPRAGHRRPAAGERPRGRRGSATVHDGPGASIRRDDAHRRCRSSSLIAIARDSSSRLDRRAAGRCEHAELGGRPAVRPGRAGRRGTARRRPRRARRVGRG